MSELETMGNPPSADQALSVSGAADAFRNLGIGKPEAAPAEEKQEASDIAVPEGADAPDDKPAESNTPDEGAGDDTPPAESFDEKAKRYRVKVDGVESQVSFEELRNGYQRNSDYLAKMRAVSDAQKAADAQREAYLARINEFVPQLEASVLGEFADIRSIQDVQRLAESDPSRYVKWQAAQMSLNQARAERDRAQNEAQQRQQTQLQEYIAEQSKQLIEKLPEFGDAEKGSKLKSDIRSYLKSEGFADQELANIADHRALLIARKAMLFDRAQKERTEAAKRIQNVPKVQKPGATNKADPNAEVAQAAFQRLNKSGRVDDAAAVFKGMKLFG